MCCLHSNHQEQRLTRTVSEQGERVCVCGHTCVPQTLPGFAGCGWEAAEPGRAPNPSQLPPWVAEGLGAPAVGPLQSPSQAQESGRRSAATLTHSISDQHHEDGRRQPTFLKFLGNFHAAPPHRYRFSTRKTMIVVNIYLKRNGNN